MTVIEIRFLAGRWHGTPWGRQVNEGAVEWPPSPWRLLRSLLAVWHLKAQDIAEEDVRSLINELTPLPSFYLPPASQGHTRHYMPVQNDDRTKVFDTFITLARNEPLVVVWPDVVLTESQSATLQSLLQKMTYLGRAESWVEAKLVEQADKELNAFPINDADAFDSSDGELERTLVAISPDNFSLWRAATVDAALEQRLQAERLKAQQKGKPVEKVKLTAKAKEEVESTIPQDLFAALHADTNELRAEGWKQLPPGGCWVNYRRSRDAFRALPRVIGRKAKCEARPKVARFAISSAVRPLLINSLWIGDRVRSTAMSHSRTELARKRGVDRDTIHCAPVFSGKDADGHANIEGHGHAHYLSECYESDRAISHLTIFAPNGFDPEDRAALGRLKNVWGKGGHDLQMVLLGFGDAEDFGGSDLRAGQSPILASSTTWITRTPFVPADRLRERYNLSLERDRHRCSLDLQRIVRGEFKRRSWLAPHLEHLESIEPILVQKTDSHAISTAEGALIGGHRTPWRNFRRERQSGAGVRGTAQGYAIRLQFNAPVSGPIAIGYGCHFGLGLFYPK